MQHFLKAVVFTYDVDDNYKINSSLRGQQS